MTIFSYTNLITKRWLCGKPVRKSGRRMKRSPSRYSLAVATRICATFLMNTSASVALISRKVIINSQISCCSQIKTDLFSQMLRKKSPEMSPTIFLPSVRRFTAKTTRKQSNQFSHSLLQQPYGVIKSDKSIN